MNNLNIVNKSDIDSLINLSQIKENQVIDVYQDGTISKPYDVGLMASGWRTARWLGGISQNREDLPKIQKLMQRTFDSYLRGDDFLEQTLRNAVVGLNHLKSSYQSSKQEGTVNEIQKIIDYVERSLISPKEPRLEQRNFIIKDQDKLQQFRRLEASCFNEPGIKYSIEGINYYRDKITAFLGLETVSQEDQQILKKIQDSLAATDRHYTPFSTFDFYEKVREESKLIPNLDELAKTSNTEPFNIAASQYKTKYVEARLAELDAMPPDQQSNIGIVISMASSWVEDGKPAGHAFNLTLCKEQDGTYTASQINAGGLSIGEKAQTNYHLNFNQPISISLPPVVEFGPLSREEAAQFLLRSWENSDPKPYDTYELAEKGYNDLFANFIERKRPDRIPPRRAQVTGNCGIRSVKEVLIFCLQKYGKADLANQLMKYQDSRQSGSSLPFEDIVPLYRATTDTTHMKSW